MHYIPGLFFTTMLGIVYYQFQAFVLFKDERKIFMKLYHLFFKFSLIENIKNYLLCMVSVIITIIVLTISNNLFENLKSGNMIPSLMYLRFKFSSIQTILSIIGGIFVLNQYYRIMRTNIKDYSLIKTLGAARNQIRILIFLQAFLLFALTVPVALILGISASDYILNALMNITLQDFSYNFINSSLAILFIVGIISCAILVFGVMLEVGINRKLPPQIDSE